MPELRGKCFPDFTPVAVNTDSISFKDKNREKQRQKQLEQQRKEREETGGKKKFVKNKAWSKQKAKREKKKKITAKRKHEEVSHALCYTAGDNRSIGTCFQMAEPQDFSLTRLITVN